MLLDTHTLLWFVMDDARLKTLVRSCIEDADVVTASIASLWEIAIKISVRKLTLGFAFSELPNFLAQLDIRILSISFADLEHYTNLPLHYRNPFDCMLIAQALVHSLAIVSADTAFDAYPVQRLWA